jgi:ABC-2 type transport system ATP-binding protein
VCLHHALVHGEDHAAYWGELREACRVRGPSLTARQNLAALAALRGNDARTMGIDDALDQVRLTDLADDRVRGFSLGMRQRLGLGAALLTKPRLLVLDEPSNGLDPAGKKHVYGVLTRLAADGASVVLSSHRMDDVESLCSEVTILATGRVAFSGPLSKLASENRELDYRVLSSDPEAARRVAGESAGIRVVDERGVQQGIEVLVVSGPVPALDELVKRLVYAGIAVRELAPVVSPLEAAFLALTEQQESKPDRRACSEGDGAGGHAGDRGEVGQLEGAAAAHRPQRQGRLRQPRADEPLRLVRRARLGQAVPRRG